MPTLTQASAETKSIIKWGIISIIVLTILFFVVRGALIVKEMLFPTPPPKPTLAFGILPKTIFPEGIKKNFTYSVDTLSGGFEKTPPTINVYRIQHNPPDLLALQKAQKMVGSLGFSSSPFQISSDTYEWKTDDQLQKHLKMNTINYNFTYSVNMSADPDLVSGRGLPSEQEAISIAQNILGNMGLLYPDIDTDKTRTQLLKFINNSFYPASSFSESQIVKVDFYQRDQNQIPIFYEKPDTTSMDFIIGGGGKIGGITFVHQTITDSFATYPVKSPNQAFEELKSGKGYVASYYGTSNNISIKNAFLAYYLGNSDQNYLLPIFVFSGDDGFFAYVSATTDESTNN